MFSDYSNYVERMQKEGFLTNLNYYQYRVFGFMYWRRPWKISSTIIGLRTVTGTRYLFNKVGELITRLLTSAVFLLIVLLGTRAFWKEHCFTDGIR
jgi:hypothetical protein